jgi:sulfide:quinone oxidoreductase
MTTNVVVLGGGLGGMTASSLLSSQIGKSGTVTVIEPRATIPLPSSLTWLALGWREPRKIQRDLKKLARRKNVRIVPEKVERIDIAGRRIATSSNEVRFDKLVVSLGADLALDSIPGLEENSQIPYSLDGAMKLRESLENFSNGKIVVGVCGTSFKCPAAPYELSLLIEEKMRTSKKKAEVELFTPEPYPLPAGGTVIGKQVERLLSNRGIKYSPKTKPTRIEKNKAVFENGTQMNYDLFIAIPPHRPPKVVVQAGLSEASGWIPVNPQNLATKHEDVYAIGDVSSIETPHGHVPYLPKAGVFAQGQAEVVANNLAVSVTGKGKMRQWDGRGSCHLQVSKSESAFVQGNFLSNPPKLEFHPANRKWYFDKVKRERAWLDWS